MRSDDPYDDLPDDPEEAFLSLEAFFRDRCDQCIRNIHEESTNICYITYISQVISAVQTLELSSIFSDRAVPRIVDIDYNTYIDFSKDVENYITALKIRRARRTKKYSVPFDLSTKVQLRHHLEQIRTIVDKIDDISEAKRESLFKKINDLQVEIDRNRTRYEALAALTIDVAEVAGEAIDKSKLLSIVDSITRLFGKAKETEAAKQLPPPAPMKQIGPPTKGYEELGAGPDLDDEIPF